MTELQSVLDRPVAAMPEGFRSTNVIPLPGDPGIILGEAELKAMRAALDVLSARFGLVPDSADYQAAAVAIVRIAGAGHFDAARVAELAANQLGLSGSPEAAK